MSKAEIPFEPFSESFRTVLVRSYLCPLAKWLFGTGPDKLLAQESNSAWEAALSVLYLIRFSQFLNDAGIENPDCPASDSIERKCLQTAEWLCSIARHVSAEELSWENVTWDTATVIRALFAIKHRFSHALPAKQRSSIDVAIKKGLLWLLRRFAIWHRTVKYPFGPADVASIAVCLVEGRQHFPKIVNEVCKTALGDETAGNEIWIRALRDISEYLLLQADVPKDYLEPDTIRHIGPCWWDDHFTTSEALEALGEYLIVAHKSPNERRDYEALIERVRTSLISAACYFERTQADGMWGSHIDTIKALYIYLKLRDYLGGSRYKDDLISDELHIVFKAIRWICDSKQFFSDGSILHTMFLTVFAAHTLLQVAEHWPSSSKIISDLYDDVVWAAPVRISAEKIERTRIALELERISRLREEESARFSSEQIAANHTLAVAKAQIRTIVFSIAWIIVTCSLALLFGIFDLQTHFKLESANNLFAFLGVMLTAYIAIVTVVWRRAYSSNQHT